MKIKTKLLVLSGVVALVLVLMTAAIYVKTSSVVTQLADTEAAKSVNYLVQMIDFYFDGLENTVGNLRPALQEMFDGTVDKQQLQKHLAKSFEFNKSRKVMEVYMALESDGSLLLGSGSPTPEGFDARTREWYRLAAAKREHDPGVITEPYVDTATGTLVITSAMPVFGATGELLGVVGVDVALDGLTSKIKTASVFEAGYGILAAPSGLVVEHPDKTFVSTENFSKASAKIHRSLASIGAKMVAGETGFGDYTLQGTTRRIYYAPTRSGYVPALVFPQDQLKLIVHSVTTIQIVAGAIALIFLFAYMFFMIPSITKPLKGVVAILKRLASLDLTPDPKAFALVDGLNEATELGAMVASLRNMHDVFVDMVESVREETARLTSSSATLDNLSQGAAAEVDQCRSAAMNVERLAQDALSSVESTTGAVHEVNQAAAMTANSATQGAEASNTTSRLSAEVYEMVNRFVSELQGVGDSSLENSKSMTDVGSSVAAIGTFVTSIRNIASQTNLLALNAAIEAARAGDAGRGFAVVADEVRKLAEDSNVASHHVVEMMKNLESGTESAIASTRESTKMVSDIIARANETQQSLKNALGEIDKVNEAVQTIAAAAEEQAASSNEIAESSSHARNSIANVAQEISSISHATAETQGAIRKVAQEATTLSSISSDLENLISRFVLSPPSTSPVKSLPSRR
ncbi:MAG: methyl-accepting chemotaxis protein [Synergistaceae bacterium]|nr:methyl-accepting chemotaxis protein [Synergistaceae bacterium]